MTKRKAKQSVWVIERVAGGTRIYLHSVHETKESAVLEAVERFGSRGLAVRIYEYRRVLTKRQKARRKT